MNKNRKLWVLVATIFLSLNTFLPSAVVFADEVSKALDTLEIADIKLVDSNELEIDKESTFEIDFKNIPSTESLGGGATLTLL